MGDWIADNAWQSWMIVATFLVIAEIMTLDLYLLMIAVGAGSAAVAAALGVPVIPQIILAGVVAMALLVFVRPPIIRRIHSGPDLVHGHAGLVGVRGIVTGDLTEHSGMIKLSGELWSARPYEEGISIAVGTSVQVIEIRGATAYVVAIPTLGS